MKTYKIFLVLICAAVLAVSCKEDEFTPYEAGDYIYFEKTTKSSGIRPVREPVDSVLFSFANFVESVNTYDIKIPVSIIGRVADHDRSFKVVIDDSDFTNRWGVNFKGAKEGEAFRIGDQFVKAGRALDSLRITALRIPAMKDGILRVRFTLVDNENFTTDYYRSPGVTSGEWFDRLNCSLYLTDMFTKPAGWNADMTTNFLGEYSLSKLDLICRLFGVDRSYMDVTPPLETATAWRGYLRVYLRENGPLYDENNVLIEVP